MLNLREYLNRIKDCEYAIAKFDSPYVPENFPDEYPIGKDLDILVSERDFGKINQITEEFLNGCLIKKFPERVYYRIEINGKLHFQIDISIVDLKILENKITKNIFYILSLENEYIIRKEELRKFPHKVWHQKWISEHLLSQ